MKAGHPRRRSTGRRAPRAAAALMLCGGAASGADHGVVLAYHHVDDATPASTSVTPDQFREHLDYLQDAGATVMRLADMLDALTAGEPVPDNAVAITFDDAYESVHGRAAPELAKRGMPFTVFVATGAVDQGHAGTMTWGQMRGLDRRLADFGAHSLSHAHLVERHSGESEEQRVERLDREIRGSARRLETELGVDARSFAYPFGEYDAELAERVAAAGLYGISQQSGAFGPGVSPRQVPRFPMSTSYAGIDRLDTALRSRPLPINAPSVYADVVDPGTPPEVLDIVHVAGAFRTEALACYGGGAALAVERMSTALRVALPQLRPGRNKINCTAPSGEAPGEFFWYSHLWIVADAEGRWLRY